MNKGKSGNALTRLLEDERSGRDLKMERTTKFIRIWFGQFAGRTVDQIPHWYLRWLIVKFKAYPALVADAEKVIKLQEKKGANARIPKQKPKTRVRRRN